jgi:VWFA-related protein
MRCPGLLLPLVASLLILAPPGATPQQPPVFGASADLVLIDLIATDDDGRFVADLRAEEIEVREGGKPQRIEFVRLVSTREATASAAAASPAGAATPPAALLPPGAPGETQAAEGFHLVVVVDLATMPADVLTRTKQAIVDMVRAGVDPGTRLMLIALERGMRVVVPFTDDAERFARAVEGLVPNAADGEAAVQQLVDRVDQVCDGTPGSLQSAVGLGRAFVENARLSMTNALEGMAAVGRYLSPLPGRKHLVYYSSGYPMDPADISTFVIQSICRGQSSATMAAGDVDVQTSLRVGSQVDSTGLLRRLVDEANRAQVSIYTVDARGLMGDVPPAGSRTPARMARSGAAQEAQRRASRAPQEILRSIGEDTGGTASVNTNELARGMKAAVADAKGYYLLAYQPPGGRKEGRYYEIDLKVKRPGLQLRYRRGYEWLSEAKRDERAIAAALRFPGLYAGDGLQLEPWFESGKLHVAVILPTRALAFRQEGGEYRNDLSVQGLLRDEKGRALEGRYLFSKQIAMRLLPERHAELLTRENVEIANEAEAPKKGIYQLSVVVRHSGGRLASASVDVEAP